MKDFSFYDPVTGELTGEHFSSSDPMGVALNVTEARPAVEGRHDHKTHRVDLKSMQIVPHTEAPPPHPVDVRYDLLAQIAALEAKQHRAVREFLLGKGGADRLREMDDAIAAIRTSLAATPVARETSESAPPAAGDGPAK